jgi:hypothetical protein
VHREVGAAASHGGGGWGCVAQDQSVILVHTTDLPQ